MGKREDKFNDYEGFVEKFKPKLTTDDCYTPENVYQAVTGWVRKEYGLEGAEFVRPFWPGGDYEHFDYPDGCVLVDNPPFSMLSQILRFCNERGIKYFLFCPYLTAMNCVRVASVIVASSKIRYENGAEVDTAFCTNLDEYACRSVPELRELVDAADRENRAAVAVQLPKYSYPDNVLTSAMLGYMSKHGVAFNVRREDVAFIRTLDSQRARKKSIYGGGVLLSEKAAAEKAAAEKAAAEKAAAEKAAAEKAAALVWELSDLERAIIAGLGKK